MGCDLCQRPGGQLLWQDALCRVVLAEEADYPGFCRVILNHHAAEMTDLERTHQQRLMAVVFATERALRDVVAPDKINLASLGNMTPHVHWHVIPRWRTDRHFPHSVWSAPQRSTPPRAWCAALPEQLAAGLEQQLGAAP